MECGALKLGAVVGAIVGTGKQTLLVRSLEHDAYSGHRHGMHRRPSQRRNTAQLE